MQTAAWRELPDMREARSYFTPCGYRGFIYLCGGFTDAVEVFNWRTDEFLQVSIRLPEAHECIAVVSGGQLLVISGNYSTRFSAGQEHNLMKQTQTQHQKVEVFCNMAPEVLEQVIYVSWRGNVNRIQLEVAEGR